MTPVRFIALPCLLIASIAISATQDFAPPPAGLPRADALKEITTKTDRLGKAIASLRKQGVRDPGLADVEIFHQAAVAIVEHQEFFEKAKDSDVATLNVLDRGLLRAKFLSTGETPWTQALGQAVPRGYRSRIDGSVQPYAVTLPADFGKDPTKHWRLDVVLHGRDATLTEVKFLNANSGDKAAPKDLQYARIDIFGRGNNAYRWAGETDVFEAIESFFANERLAGRDKLTDAGRIVLRGFSMGGAGTWHIGLHYPDRWCCIGPGAGFTTTHGYIKNLPDQLPPHQEACLHIYDAVDYAANAFNVPVVAYSGAKDPQKAAADNIEARLKKLGIDMTHIIAPDLEHKFPPEWQAKADVHWSEYAHHGRDDYPRQVRFTTYTMKYASCAWVEIMGLERHYQQAAVEADRHDSGFNLATQNVRALHLTLPEGTTQNQQIVIDKQKLDIKPWTHQNGSTHLYLQKSADGWRAVLPQKLFTERLQRPQKIAGLQGPIDDAFTDAFLCVRSTGKPWHAATQAYADGNLQRFQAEWSKFLRGQLPIKDDIDVTNEDIATKHLILFGDPSSNSIISQVIDALPLRWTKDQIVCAGASYTAGDHVPVMIQPNPLNAARYVVVNSGHTFHAAEFRGTNALLYPRLGDWAVLKLAPTATDSLGAEAIAAGLFDEYWRIDSK
jgi:dienelactone hydrolase